VRLTRSESQGGDSRGLCALSTHRSVSGFAPCRRLFSLGDSSTDPVTRLGVPGMSDVRNWRDRVAHAAAADVGRAGDKATISQARRLVDSCARRGLGILVAPGAFIGWLATYVHLYPAAGQVHAEWALMTIVASPWLCLASRGAAMLLLQWHSTLLLDCLGQIRPLQHRLTSTLLPRSAAPQNLTKATATETYKMLADTDAGRPLSAAGSGVFWTAYAVAAVATMWIVTNHVALGFGFGWTWESSHLPLYITRGAPELAAAVTEFPALVLGWIGSDGLPPVAPAPVAPADNPEALSVRRSWLLVLTAGVGAYLLLPMAILTLFIYVYAYRKMTHWQPAVVPIPRSAASATRCRSEPAAAPLRSPPVGGGMCTHVVRLERPRAAVDLPAPLDQLVDLGDAGATADLERVRGKLCDDKARVVVVSRLRVPPDRGVEDKLRTLASASTAAPLLVLDGSHAVRRSEPGGTLAIRREEWRAVASRTGVTPFECDLAELTDECRRDLARAVGYGEGSEGGRQPATEPSSESTRR